MSGTCSQKRLSHPKEYATDALQTSSKRSIQKTAEATGYLIGNTIAKRITVVSKHSPQNNSKLVKNKHDQEVST